MKRSRTANASFENLLYNPFFEVLSTSLIMNVECCGPKMTDFEYIKWHVIEIHY